jgi:hypothetical protein
MTVSQWNVILPSLAARRYNTYGLHRFLFFFLSFSLSFHILMSVFIFPCFSDFTLTLYPFISIYLWFISTIFTIVYFAKYYWGDHTKEDEMTGHLAVTEGKGNRILVGKIRRKRRLGGTDRGIK